MKPMPCTAQIRDGRLRIGIPKSAFIAAVEDFRKQTDAVVWIPDPNVIEVSEIVIEFRAMQAVSA